MKRIEKLISEAENICVITHTDTDGICSAGILLKALKKITKKDIEIKLASASILRTKKFYENLPISDLIIFTDLPIDQSWDIADKEIGNKKIIIIDHHIPLRNLNSSKIIHINPMFDRDIYIPASKIVFDIFSDIVDIKKYDWMAAVGILGDMGMADSKVFLKNIFKKYNFESKKKDMRDTLFTKVDELIGSAMICKGEEGAMRSLKIVENSERYEDILENEELNSYRKKVENYLEELKNEFEKTAEYFKEIDTIMFETSPKYNIGSVLATVVSRKILDKTIIILNKRSKTVNLNFRRQDGKVDVKELAEFATQGIGKGGGHKKAAGGTISIDKIDEFKIRVMSWLMSKDKRK